MRREHAPDEAPLDVWLLHKSGQYDMPRTSPKDTGAVHYVLAQALDDALEYIERMTGGNTKDPVSVLVELRWALGDEGKRSVPELIEFAKELANRPAPGAPR